MLAAYLAIYTLLGLLLGVHALAVIYLLPMAILGVMLLFAGSQLALTVMDVNSRKDLFVALMILGITLAAVPLFHAVVGKQINPLGAVLRFSRVGWGVRYFSGR